jgi:nitroreductase
VSAVDERAGTVMEAIRSRRVTRAFTAERVADEDLRMVVEAARWASSAGNRRINSGTPASGWMWAPRP